MHDSRHSSWWQTRVDHRTFQLFKSLLMPQLWQVLGRSGHEIPEVTKEIVAQ